MSSPSLPVRARLDYVSGRLSEYGNAQGPAWSSHDSFLSLILKTQGVDERSSQAERVAEF